MITDFIFAVMMENSDEVIYCVFEDKEEAEKFIEKNFSRSEAWIEEIPIVRKKIMLVIDRWKGGEGNETRRDRILHTNRQKSQKRLPILTIEKM